MSIVEEQATRQKAQDEEISKQAFAILPEYFWDKFSQVERERRTIFFRKAFAEAKKKVLARKNPKPEFWFELGGGI